MNSTLDYIRQVRTDSSHHSVKENKENSINQANISINCGNFKLYSPEKLSLGDTY